MDQPITWQKDFSVGIKVIDDQHQHMIEIINELFEKLTTTLGPIDITSFFEDAIAYSEYHFQTEENFFSHYPYSEQAAHLQAHRDYKNKINSLMVHQSDLNATAKAAALLDFLNSWWVGHITGMDQTLRFLVTSPDTASAKI